MKRTPAERLYALLLWAHPPAFRRACGEEILQFVRTASAHGPVRPTLLMAGSDGLRSLAREWTAAIVRPRVAGTAIHDYRAGEPMRNLVRDIGLGIRLLAKSPAFTLAAVLTLALGIGANTAMFTLADATLLRPLSVHEPEQLVVWSWTSSYPHYKEYAKRTDIFQGVLAAGGVSRVNLAIDGSAELAHGAFLSGNAFDVIGVGAAHGRTLLPSDDVPNGPIVAVLSYDYWRSRFGGDPSVVGRTLTVNRRPATVVGVAEKGFRGTTLSMNPSLYLPTAVSSQVRTGFMSRVDPLTTRGFVWLNVIGRLRTDVTVAQATAAMDAMYSQLQPAGPGGRSEALRLEPLQTRALGSGAAGVKSFVTLLLGVVGLTLLIGCANLANLLLAKAAARRREMGVRLALGATRARVVQQLLVESVVLATIGGAAGLAVAIVALRMLARFQLPGGLEIANLPLELNGAALAVTFGLSLVTGLLFGAVPAWRASRTDVVVSLRDQSRSATTRSGVRTALLGAQVALSLVLLAGTGLFARSLMSALDLPLGFDPRHVVTASVNLGLARYDSGRAESFYSAALGRVRNLPQVQAAAWGNLMPTRGLFMGESAVDGYTQAPGEGLTVYGAHAGPDYFSVLGTRLLAGRVFLDTDTAGSTPVGLISEAMARKYWNGRDPIGGRFRMFDRWVTVVGVVENTVVRELREQPVPQVYLAFDQWLDGPQGIATDAAHLFVRGSGDPETLIPLLREQLRALNPELPLYDIGPFEERVARLVMPQRMGVALFTLFSALALALATVGIYGVATYVTALRTREIGIRMALGASSAAVRRMVLVQGARPVVLGIIGGLALALYASRLVEAFLLGLSPYDPVTFAAVTALLAAIALVAIYVPARRAARIEPVSALRDE